jgi:hypothetical protein
VQDAVEPRASKHFMTGSAGEDLEIDFGMGVSGKHQYDAAGLKFFHGKSAAHEGFRAKLSAGVNFPVRARETLRVS